MMIMFYSRHYELSCIAVALWILWFKLLWFSSGWYPPTNQQLSSPLLLYVITLYILVLIIALFPGFQTDNTWATTVEWGITTSAHQSRLTTLFSFSSHGNHNRYIVGVEEVRLLWMRQQREFGGVLWCRQPCMVRRTRWQWRWGNDTRGSKYDSWGDVESSVHSLLKNFKQNPRIGRWDLAEHGCPCFPFFRHLHFFLIYPMPPKPSFRVKLSSSQHQHENAPALPTTTIDNLRFVKNFGREKAAEKIAK